MKFLIKNMGIIKEATIAIDGLAVIAGDNDTGKSFAGRALFSVVKAAHEADRKVKSIKGKELLEQIEDLYVALRKEVSFADNKKIQKLFDPTDFFRELNAMIDDKNIIGIEDALEERKNALIGQEEEERKEVSAGQEKKDNTFSAAKHMPALMILESLIFSKERKERIRKNNVEKIFASEFHGEIACKYGQPGQLVFTEGGNNILSILLDNNGRVAGFEITDELYYQDVTLIETPVIVQMYDTISNSRVVYERSHKPSIPLHMRDVVDKLSRSSLSESDEATFSRQVSETISGDWAFSSDTQDFLYSKNQNGNKIDFRSLNTATGIKSFGMLALLKKAGVLNKRSILVIDEPEVHLHPKWQIEYARVIVALVKEGVPVLVTTHSPYMLQAFKQFSVKEQIHEKTKVYFAEKQQDGLVVFEDVTKNLKKPLQSLSEPFKKLVWGED